MNLSQPELGLRPLHDWHGGLPTLSWNLEVFQTESVHASAEI